MLLDGRTYATTAFAIGERVRFPDDEDLPTLADRLRIGVLRFLHVHPLTADVTELVSELQTAHQVDAAAIRAVVDGMIADGTLEDVDRMPIRTLDLSVTSRCNARCISCPTPRQPGSDRCLQPDELDRLLGQLEGLECCSRLETVEVGGLHEPLLHPELPELLRRLRRLRPARLILDTNGSLLEEELSRILLAEALLDELVVSVDGLTEAEHELTKGLSLAPVERNLLAFLREREALGADCSVTIQVLSYRRYCDEVQRILGRPPLAVPEVDPTLPDSTAAVLQRWRQRLEARDRVVDAMDHFQLRGEDRREDEPFPIPESALRCPWLSYVAHTMSLTAAGDWRICCNDFHAEGVLGNVFTEPLAEIAGPRRARFLRALLANDLDQLPRRCTRKRYCQYIT